MCFTKFGLALAKECSTLAIFNDDDGRGGDDSLVTGVTSCCVGADDDRFAKVEGVTGFEEFKVAGVDGETSSFTTGGRLFALRGTLAEFGLVRERGRVTFGVSQKAEVAITGRGCKSVGDGAIAGA